MSSPPILYALLSRPLRVYGVKSSNWRDKKWGGNFFLKNSLWFSSNRPSCFESGKGGKLVKACFLWGWIQWRVEVGFMNLGLSSGVTKKWLVSFLHWAGRETSQKFWVHMGWGLVSSSNIIIVKFDIDWVPVKAIPTFSSTKLKQYFQIGENGNNSILNPFHC